MAFLSKGRKVDLQILCEELNVETLPEHKVIDLKNLITKSKEYDPEFTEGLLNNIIAQRLEQEEAKKLEEKEAKKREEEAKKREEEAGEVERQRLALEAERAFELEKLRLEARVQAPTVTRDGDSTGNSRGFHDLQKIMQKFDPKEGDISLWLVLFERQAEHAQIRKLDWVSHLLGLLPYDITQLIAREEATVAYDYDHIKELLLKRFKLSPETFRVKFIQHKRTEEKTWKDFAFELRNYFEEWVDGLKVTTMEGLMDLMIVDQLKRKVPFEVKEHFVDEWSSITSPAVLAELLDKYESVRGFRKKTGKQEEQTVKRVPYGSKSPSPNESQGAIVKSHSYHHQGQNNRRNVPKEYETQNARSKVTCFLCKEEGHIKKNCPKVEKYRSDQDTRRRANVNVAAAKEETREAEVSRSASGPAVVARVSSFKDDVRKKDLCQLERIPVSVDGKPAKALIDSGTEITVVRDDVVQGISVVGAPSIYIKGIFGPAEKCPLINIPIGLIIGGKGDVVHQDVLCAVAPSLVEDVLLPPDIREMLKGKHEEVSTEDSELSVVEQSYEERVQGQPLKKITTKKNVVMDKMTSEMLEVEHVNEVQRVEMSKAEIFRKEQEEDGDLEETRKQAKEGRGGFYFKDDLLFHSDKILGEKVSQFPDST